MRRIAAAVLAVALGGCALTYEPDVGPMPAAAAADAGAGASAGSAACIDGDPSTPVSFARQVRPLTTRSPGGCLFCHGATTTSGLSVGSYASLRRGGLISGTHIIVPGKPCESVLYGKLGVAPPFGSRMPYNGPPYFTASELALVRDWIAEGALDN